MNESQTRHLPEPLELPAGQARWGLATAKVRDACWMLLVCLTPLLVNLWGRQPFELPKVAMMRTLVWFLAALAIIEWYAAGPRQLRWPTRIRAVYLPAATLSIVLVVSTATAAQWRVSLWGSYERAQGALTLLTYLLLFILATLHFQSRRRARRLIGVMVAALAPLLLLSFLQTAGWNPIGLVSNARSPLFATLGRANFLGSYLALTAPLTLALLVLAKTQLRRALIACLLTGQLLIILFTLARSAWLATAVGLALFALLLRGPALTRQLRRASWCGVTVLGLSGTALIAGWGERLGGSAAARQAIWNATAGLIAERPLLGYGADALGTLFPRVYPADLVYLQGREVFVDRAHQLVLDWVFTAGLPGLLAYGVLLLLFVTSVTRILRRSQSMAERALPAALAAAVLGNVVNNLASFDVTATATASWLLMGMGVALSEAQSVTNVTFRIATPATAVLRRRALTGIALVGVGAAVWLANIRPLIADIYARQSVIATQQGDTIGAVRAAERAASQWPEEPAHRLLLADAYWAAAIANPASASSWLALAEAALDEAERLRPEAIHIWFRRARFYAAAGVHFDAGTMPLAHQAFQQAARLAPNDATIYAAWGGTYLRAGDVHAAAARLRRAVELDATHAEAHLHLGAAELELGRAAAALGSYREAARLVPRSAAAHAGIARALWALERPSAASSAAREALRHDPQNDAALSILEAIARTQ